MVERRIKAARFPAVKSLDSFDFAAIPRLNKMQVLEMARCEWIERRENAIALGPSGTGKTHVALGLGLAACQKGLSVGFTTAAALVSENCLCLAEDGEGSLWIGTPDGLVRWDGRAWSRVTTAEGLCANHVDSLLAGRRSGLWAGSWSV